MQRPANKQARKLNDRVFWIRLSADDIERLKRVAAEADRSAAAHVRHVVRAHLDSAEVKS